MSEFDEEKDYRELFGWCDEERKYTGPLGPVREFLDDMRESYRSKDPVGKLMFLFRVAAWTVIGVLLAFGVLIQLNIIK